MLIAIAHRHCLVLDFLFETINQFSFEFQDEALSSSSNDPLDREQAVVAIQSVENIVLITSCMEPSILL